MKKKLVNIGHGNIDIVDITNKIKKRFGKFEAECGYTLYDLDDDFNYVSDFKTDNGTLILSFALLRTTKEIEVEVLCDNQVKHIMKDIYEN